MKTIQRRKQVKCIYDLRINWLYSIRRTLRQQWFRIWNEMDVAAYVKTSSIICNYTRIFCHGLKLKFPIWILNLSKTLLILHKKHIVYRPMAKNRKNKLKILLWNCSQLNALVDIFSFCSWLRIEMVNSKLFYEIALNCMDKSTHLVFGDFSLKVGESCK